MHFSRYAVLAKIKDRANQGQPFGESLSPIQEGLIDFTAWEYSFAWAWFLSLEQGGSIPLGAPLKIAEAYKPLGVVLQKLFHLCINVFAYKKYLISKIIFDDPTEWFTAVSLELAGCEAVWRCTTVKIPDRRKKRFLINCHLKDLRQLKNYENPTTTADRMPATQVLLGGAIELAERPSPFDELAERTSPSDLKHSHFNCTVYQPFLKAVAAEIEERAKESSCIHADKLGRPYLDKGKNEGRAREYLPM